MPDSGAWSSKALILCIGVLSLLHASILVVASFSNAPVHDEVAHLIATVDIVERGRFDLYRVNPPFAKLPVALVLAGAEYQNTIGHYDQRPGTRQAWELGARFFDANGDTAFILLRHARWACIPLSLVGLAVCVIWASELYSQPAGMMAGVLWTLSPTVLGNAGLMTPDVASASFGLLAAYAFWKFLERPGWLRTLLAGGALGLALLTKMTWVIAFAIWPLTALLCCFRLRATGRSMPPRIGVAAGTVAVLVVGLYVLNLGYGFEGTFTRLGDYKFVSQALAGGERNEFHLVGGNRFSGTIAGELPLPVPQNWLLGIDVQKVDFEYPYTAYMAGEWKDGGWYWYYLYCVLVKSPLTTLTLIGGGLVATGVSVRSLQSGEIVVLTVALAIFALVSSQTNLNRHFRYILPSLGFFFILSGRLVGLVPPGRRLAVVVVLSVILALESLAVFPFFGAFFNVAAGGSQNGRCHLAHSSVDWGQGMFALRDWVQKHPEAQPLHIAWAGYVTPDDLGIQYAYFPQQRGTALDRPAEPGWYIINLGTLHQKDSRYKWIDMFSAEETVAHTVLIYRLTEDNVREMDTSSRHQSTWIQDRSETL